jgi:Sigma-70 region 2
VTTVAASLYVMNPITLRSRRPEAADSRDASAIVAQLYAKHALTMTRLARIMLDDPDAAQDVVHDAFCGLIRRWSRLTDQDKAAAYLRSTPRSRSRCSGWAMTRPRTASG